MDYRKGSPVWEFDGGTLSCLHPAVSFKVVRKLQIKGIEDVKKKEFLKGNMKRVCFSDTEEITCPGCLPAEYISAPLDLPATNRQNKCDTAHVCQAI